MKKFISFILVVVFIFALLPSVTVSAENVQWKQYLKDFLVTKFPSLYDEEAIKKNDEIFKKIDESYRNDAQYTMKEAAESNIDNLSNDISLWGYRFMLPWCSFYDIDNDGIPEVIADYGAQDIGCENGSGFREIYKFYGTSYERIKSNDFTDENYYVTPENRIVAYAYFNGVLDYIEIINKEILYSECNLSEDEIYNDCTQLPEFDISDVINSIKYGTPLKNPKTGDANIITFYIIFIASAAVFVAIKNRPVKII